MIGVDANFGAIAAWNVVFMENPERHWWDIFTTTGFRHVCAFGYATDHDLWVIVNPTHGLMSISVLNDQGFDAWRLAAHPYVTTILNIPVGLATTHRNRIGHTCVAAIKQLLGLPSGAFTPFGLYRHMLASNATTVQRRAHVLRIIQASRNEKPESRSPTG